MKRYIYLFLTFFLPLVASAQHVRVVAPSKVGVGDEFAVQYSISAEDVENIKLGNPPAGIEFLGGPQVFSQSSYQTINGHTTSSSSVSCTYYFVATRKGTFTIPPARIIVHGHTIASTPVRITAIGNSNASAASNNYGRDDEPIEVTRPQSKVIGNKDLFIKVSASKTRVYEQEPVVLTYKVYSLVNLVGLSGSVPNVSGFHIQEVKLPQQKIISREKLNGRTYNCATWYQYVMFPQVTGKLKVPSITFKAEVRPDPNDFDPFAFIDGQMDIVKDIVAPGITIDVLPLPAKPACFSGGVGKFNITAQLDKTEVKAGDPINLRLIVNGVGNLKLIKQPAVSFPKGFETYDAKISDKTNLTANGVEGNMVYDYLAVPRTEGEYTIPSVQFVYFDSSTNSYKTVQTASFKVNVLKGDGISQDIDELTQAENATIRGIKTGKETSSSTFFGSFLHWMLWVIILAVFGVLFYFLRKRSVMQSDLVFIRGKNAEKVATSKMYNAKQLMLKGRSSDFYDEVLHALWGYVSNRLNMPVEELSRENISEKLRGKNVDEATVNKFIGALDECEFERYAPGDEKGNMKVTFDSAIDAITSVEEAMNVKKASGKRGAMLLLMLVGSFVLSTTLMAQDKSIADAAYAKGNYEQAIRIYEEILKKNKSSEVYYNLGNAYYKINNITKSIIAYERALRLSPSDEDIIYNLNLARTKTIDRFTAESEMFFVTWYKQLVNTLSIDGWAYAGIVFLVLSLSFVLVYFFSSKLNFRKLGFTLGILFCICFVLSLVFALQQDAKLDNTNAAVIKTSTAQIKITLDLKAGNAIVLHEGTKITITDRTIKDWFEVEAPNGVKGWVKTNSVEEI